MMAEASLRETERLTGRKIPTIIQPVSEFYVAERRGACGVHGSS